MPVRPGARLGPYEVLGLIGSGGMGEVYKARDTRLNRTVALKVLPPELSPDPERRQRFEHEAKIISALNHPHICTLHDVGEAELPSPESRVPSPVSVSYLVMEYLEGETLAHRLRNGPLPLEQAVTLAAELADALAFAHRHAIIHRDVKPANVMLTKSGTKLLDFGLAKLRSQTTTALSDVSGLPTALLATTPGAVMGTVPYMAPEQLQGKGADVRTDLFGFGCVLYEMLAGRRAFEGDSDASVISAIMSSEPPPPSALRPVIPPALDRLVRRCLAKSPDDRPDGAHDVAEDLRWMHEGSGGENAAAVRRVGRQLLRRLIACLATGIVIGAGVMWLLRPPSDQVPVARPSLDVRPADALQTGGVYGGARAAGGSRTALAWTPDAKTLVFVGRRGGVRQIYLRRLDGTEARPLANTEGAQAPAVSADGQWVAFWAPGSEHDSALPGAIRRVRLDGGSAMDVAANLGSLPIGLAWGDDGRLYFGRDDGRIWAVTLDGKTAPVTTLRDGERAHTLPCPLPGGEVLLYTVRKRQISWGDEEVVAQTLANGQRKLLLQDAADVRYARSGHLLFLRRGVMFAVAFDAERLDLRGSAVPVLDSVAQALTGNTLPDITGAGQFAVSAEGTLAWVPSSLIPHHDAVLAMVNRRGEVSQLSEAVRSYAGAVRLSPDGRQLLVTTNTLTGRGLWVYDLSRETLEPLMLEGEVYGSSWSPDGQRVAFGWLKDGHRSLAMRPADGAAPPRIVAEGEFAPSAFTPDGRHVIASRGLADTVMVAVDHGDVQPLFETSHREDSAQLSPDGGWLLYMSMESGRGEVYVRPYPGPGARKQVSLDGGWNPAWNPNGRELFFLTPSQDGRRRMMAVDFAGARAGQGPWIGRPHPLFEFAVTGLQLACEPNRCYDVAPDGQRFYAVRFIPAPPLPPVTHVNLIPNWFKELKAKAPPGR